MKLLKIKKIVNKINQEIYIGKLNNKKLIPILDKEKFFSERNSCVFHYTIVNGWFIVICWGGTAFGIPNIIQNDLCELNEIISLLLNSNLNENLESIVINHCKRNGYYHYNYYNGLLNIDLP